MTFVVNEPEANELISISQGILKQNNQILDASFSTDHVALTDATATERGKHKYTHLKSQAAAPATSANEGAVYVKTATGVDDLYYRHKSNGTEVKLTAGGAAGGNVLAWGLVRGEDGGGVAVMYGSNIAGIAANPPGGVGNYVITFTLPVASTNYIVLWTSADDVLTDVTHTRVMSLELSTKTQNSFLFKTCDVGGGFVQHAFYYGSIMVIG